VVRPEDLHLDLTGPGEASTSPGTLAPQGTTQVGGERPAAPSSCLQATVTQLTLQGGHVLVGLEMPAPVEALVPVGAVLGADIRVGSAVGVRVEPADVHALSQL